MKVARIIILSLIALFSFLLVVSEPQTGAWDDNILIYIITRACAMVVLAASGIAIVELTK